MVYGVHGSWMICLFYLFFEIVIRRCFLSLLCLGLYIQITWITRRTFHRSQQHPFLYFLSSITLLPNSVDFNYAPTIITTSEMLPKKITYYFCQKKTRFFPTYTFLMDDGSHQIYTELMI